MHQLQKCTLFIVYCSWLLNNYWGKEQFLPPWLHLSDVQWTRTQYNFHNMFPPCKYCYPEVTRKRRSTLEWHRKTLERVAASRWVKTLCTGMHKERKYIDRNRQPWLKGRQTRTIFSTSTSAFQTHLLHLTWRLRFSRSALDAVCLKDASWLDWSVENETAQYAWHANALLLWPWRHNEVAQWMQSLGNWIFTYQGRFGN